MSEGIAYGAQAPTQSRTQPGYGEGRLGYEEPPKAEEHLDRGAELGLAFAILLPVIVAYGVAAYGLYLAIRAIL